MTYYSALFLVALGAGCIAWTQSSSTTATEHAALWLGIYSILVGLALWPLEHYTAHRLPLFGGEPGTVASWPWRGILYLALSAPLWSKLSTIMAGGALASAAVVSIYAEYRGERCAGKKREPTGGGGRETGSGASTPTNPSTPATSPALGPTRAPSAALAPVVVEADAASATGPTWSQRLELWLVEQRESDEVGKWVMLFLYVGGNVAFAVYLYLTWTKAVKLMRDDYDECIRENEHPCTPPLTFWAPTAKVCGGLLNLNCSLLILPVLKSLLRALNNLRCGANGSGDLATYIPLRKNVIFHRLIGTVVGVLSLVHVVAHLFNFSVSPDTTLATFPNTDDEKKPWYGSVYTAPWYTGAGLTMAMFFLYSAAGKKTRHADYEIFWFAHNAGFVVFYVCLIFHGPVFIYWAGLPLLLYVVERLMRIRRGNRTVYLKTVRWIDPVLALEFCPKYKDEFTFTEGQYLYLNCPAISANEWHPFTISSALGDLRQQDYISVHIRIHPGGWTEKLKNMLETFNPRKEYPFPLFRVDEHGKRVLGKDIGPDGLPLIKVDGPHAAPTQHYDAYDSCVLIGAGIGLTPMAAIIRAILMYKWKKGFRPTHLTFCWVLRQNEVNAFQWFIRYLAEIEAERAKDLATGNVNPRNFLEFHIFVTRVERGATPPPFLESATLSPEAAAYATFTPEMLFRECFLPSATTRNFGPTLQSPETARNRLQDMYAWDGRPPWDAVFQRVRERSIAADFRSIGVTFCGATIIGKDLKEMCAKYSSVKDNVMFHLHKENF